MSDTTEKDVATASTAEQTVTVEVEGRIIQAWDASAGHRSPSGMWYVLTENPEDGMTTLWEAWAWSVDPDKPPQTLHQTGWRFVKSGVEKLLDEPNPRVDKLSMMTCFTYDKDGKVIGAAIGTYGDPHVHWAASVMDEEACQYAVIRHPPQSHFTAPPTPFPVEYNVQIEREPKFDPELVKLMSLLGIDVSDLDLSQLDWPVIEEGQEPGDVYIKFMSDAGVLDDDLGNRFAGACVRAGGGFMRKRPRSGFFKASLFPDFEAKFPVFKVQCA